MNNLTAILGMNERNINYVYKENLREYYITADNKIVCKEILDKAQIPTPKLMFHYHHFFELHRMKSDLSRRADFVMKPARGMGGNGILIFDRFESPNWVTTSGEVHTEESLSRHAAEIIYGVYSIDNTMDAVMIEEKIQLDDFYERITYKGIPDIRVIVYKCEPVMAMLRIPTLRSQGKANLHMGGVGVGIDIESGITTLAGSKNGPIETHPDTGADLCGLQLEYWDVLLEYCRRIQESVPLGFLGVDFVVDRRFGPQVIELNVRPGLEIQNVNQMGLKKVLRSCEGISL